MAHLVAPLALAFALAVPAAAQSLPGWAAPAAPEAPPDGEVAALPPSPGAPPAQVPIDGGLALLAIAGAGYAARRLRSE